MANRTRKCRVCGKEFVPCGKKSSDINAFNYREVACSPECGQKYLKAVLDARKPKVEEPQKEELQQEVREEDNLKFNKKIKKNTRIEQDA